MFSVTAPGPTSNPFDPGSVRTSPSQRCSGRIGCQVAPEMASAFNGSAGKWWSELHRAAKARADRATGFKGKSLRASGRSRSAGSHTFMVLGVSYLDELAWAQAYVTALRQMAPRYGFGFVDGWDKIGRRFWPGEQAAAYLSSYFVRGRGGKVPITENVLAGDLPRLVVFVGRHLRPDWMHDAEPARSPSTLGLARGPDRPTGVRVRRAARRRRDASTARACPTRPLTTHQAGPRYVTPARGSGRRSRAKRGERPQGAEVGQVLVQDQDTQRCPGRATVTALGSELRSRSSKVA